MFLAAGDLNILSCPGEEQMTKVTDKQFFEALYADSRDIMPGIVSGFPYRSEWRDQKTISRELFGITQDVYRNGRNGLTDTEYYLVRANWDNTPA